MGLGKQIKNKKVTTDVVLVTVVLVLLKLVHVISWSWFWVLSPLWLTGGFIFLVLSLMITALTLALNKEGSYRPVKKVLDKKIK